MLFTIKRKFSTQQNKKENLESAGTVAFFENDKQLSCYFSLFIFYLFFCFFWWHQMDIFTLYKFYIQQFTVLNLCAMDAGSCCHCRNWTSGTIIFKRKGFSTVPFGEENRPLLWRENIFSMPGLGNISLGDDATSILVRPGLYFNHTSMNQDSNCRPPVYQSNALPTELSWLDLSVFFRFFLHSIFFYNLVCSILPSENVILLTSKEIHANPCCWAYSPVIWGGVLSIRT